MSFTELMVIGVIALIVIGPERLPKVARTVGHLLGRAQRYVSDVKADIQREVELDELRKFKEEMDTAASDMKQSMRETQSAVENAGQSLRSELNATAKEAQDAVKDVKNTTEDAAKSVHDTVKEAADTATGKIEATDAAAKAEPAIPGKTT